MEKVLESYRRREFFGVERLVDAASEIIQEINEKPRQGKVLEIPTIRTVRYYISEGLLPAANEKRGHSSLFRYPHLLALLLIKWFQVWGIPMSAIQESMEKMSIEQMERAFGQRVMVFTDPDQMTSYIETHGRDENEDLVVVNNPRAAFDYVAAREDQETLATNRATEYLGSLLAPSPEMTPSASQKAPRYSASIDYPDLESEELFKRDRIQSSVSGDGGLWRRIPISEGLEINMESKFKTPANEEHKRALIRIFEAMLTKQND